MPATSSCYAIRAKTLPSHCAGTALEIVVVNVTTVVIIASSVIVKEIVPVFLLLGIFLRSLLVDSKKNE